MRGIRTTLVLLLAFLALAAYAYFVESKRPSRAEAENVKEKVFSIESADITGLQVKAASGDRTVLQNTDGVWTLVEPVAVDADAADVSGITSTLASLEIQRIVQDAPSDLERYGLDHPRIELGFKTADQPDFTRLLIGNKTATGGDMYAKVDGADRVFLVAAYLDSSLNRTTFDLRDKSILKFDREHVDRLELTDKEGSIELVKADAEWRINRPWSARGDASTIDGLVGRLNTTQMKTLEASESDDLASYGLDHPRVTATLGAGSASATLQIGRARDDGAAYAHDVSRPLIFTVDASLVDDLERAPSAYRRHDVFDFRSFTATRLEITRGESTVAFEKGGASDTDASDEQPVWRQVAPTAADIDQAKLSDLLSKLSGLRAESFIDSRSHAGLDSPVATIVARFGDDARQEQVAFGRVGADVYAASPDDEGAARIDASQFEAALALLDELEDGPSTRP